MIGVVLNQLLSACGEVFRVRGNVRRCVRRRIQKRAPLGLRRLNDLFNDSSNNAFNVAVHRLRKAFGRAGLTEQSGVIERDKGQVRLGIGSIEIVGA